jgi:serine/threonine protein kinase
LPEYKVPKLAFPDYRNANTNDEKADLPIFQPMTLDTLLPKLDPAGIDLVSKMLAYIPEQRISAEEALKHPFFDSAAGTNEGGDEVTGDTTTR